MRVSFIPAVIISAVVISLILLVVNQVDKGETRVVQSVVTGSISALVSVSLMYWMREKKSDSDSGGES